MSSTPPRSAPWRWSVAAVVAAMQVIACGGQEPALAVGQPPSGPAQGVTLVSYQPRSDGTLEAVEQVISIAEYEAMRDRRSARQQEAAAGAPARLASLVYRGAGTGAYPIEACDDDRTTWLSSTGSFDPAAPGAAAMVLGCVGAGPGQDDWTGTVDLGALSYPWQSQLNGVWASNSYEVRLCNDDSPATPPFCCAPLGCYRLIQTSIVKERPVRVCQRIAPWSVVYVGNSGAGTWEFTDPGTGGTCELEARGSWRWLSMSVPW